MRGVRLLLVSAGVALGIVAEQQLYDWASADRWLPDLAAGWALIGCGLLAWWLIGATRTGGLMATAGFLWFAGNFVGTSSSWLTWIAAHEQYAYRGPLVHLVLTFPRGRPKDHVGRGAVAAAYV